MDFTRNNCTIGGKDCWMAPGVSGLNRLEMKTGGAFGKGVFCMMRKDYDALVPQGGQHSLADSTATLSMDGSPGPGMQIPVILAGAEPIVQSAGSDNSIDFMRVTVYDVRVGNFRPVSKYYNVVKDGFNFSGATPICYSSTLNSSAQWTWSQIITNLELTAGNTIPPNVPTWTPMNVIYDGAPFSGVVDDLAAQLFYIVGFDPTKSAGSPYYLFSPLPFGTQFLLDGTLPTYSNGNTLNFANHTFQENLNQFIAITAFGALLNGVVPGADGAAERNIFRLPGSIVVSFPTIDVSSTDPYVNRFYTKTINTGFGATDYKVNLNVGNFLASYNGSFVNQANLDAVATDLVSRAVNFMAQNWGQAEIAGIWPFKPDGIFRQIEWVSDEKGARTLISSGNRKDWEPGDSLDDVVNFPAKQEVIAFGSGLSTIGPGGVKYVTSAGGGGGVIPLSLTQTGGSDGTASTAATWTYSATNAITGASFGTGMSPAVTRPNGQTVAASWGLGYVAAGINILLYAFERPNTKLGCS